jgi:hypothetical protein
MKAPASRGGRRRGAPREAGYGLNPWHSPPPTLYTAMSCFFGTRSRITATGASGSASRSTLTALRSAAAASDSAEKMMPGESSRRMDLSSTTSCTPRVTPGVLPTWPRRAEGGGQREA